MGNKSKRHFLLLLLVIVGDILIESWVGRKLERSYRKYEEREAENIRRSIKNSKSNKGTDEV